MSNNTYLKVKTDLVSCAVDFNKDDLDAYELYVLSDSYLTEATKLYCDVLKFKEDYALEYIKLEHFNLVAKSYNLPLLSKNIDDYTVNDDEDVHDEENKDNNKFKFISTFVGNIKDIGDITLTDIIVSLLFNLIIITVCGFISFGYIIPKVLTTFDTKYIPIFIGVLIVFTCIITVSGMYCKELKFIKNNSKVFKKNTDNNLK